MRYSYFLSNHNKFNDINVYILIMRSLVSKYNSNQLYNINNLDTHYRINEIYNKISKDSHHYTCIKDNKYT